MARRSTANHRCSDFGFGYGGRVGCGELAGAKARFIGEGGAKGGRVEHLSRHVRQEHGGSGESRQLCRRALSVGHGISRAARRLARGAAAAGRLRLAEAGARRRGDVSLAVSASALQSGDRGGRASRVSSFRVEGQCWFATANGEVSGDLDRASGTAASALQARVSGFAGLARSGGQGFWPRRVVNGSLCSSRSLHAKCLLKCLQGGREKGRWGRDGALVRLACGVQGSWAHRSERRRRKRGEAIFLKILVKTESVIEFSGYATV
uniref:Uncharacterized protein n=2 Tax=Oryza TaxID=4527 RepID=Q2QU36_ORYSJ|nr:hypothetical protein LOC_Os12g17610 [Oryza sativa Japonica Group]